MHGAVLVAKHRKSGRRVAAKCLEGAEGPLPDEAGNAESLQLVTQLRWIRVADRQGQLVSPTLTSQHLPTAAGAHRSCG